MRDARDRVIYFDMLTHRPPHRCAVRMLCASRFLWTAVRAVRAGYLADAGGRYSGITQYLKEGTLTLDYRPANGLLVRGEFRRDQSKQLYFWGPHLNLLESSQLTLGAGLAAWFGSTKGPW